MEVILVLLVSDETTEGEEASEHLAAFNSVARSARNFLPDMT